MALKNTPIDTSIQMHASAVALDGHAALLVGASGSGKSTLALQLLALGCDLVADDQCIVCRKEGKLRVSASKTLPNLIEARGVGLLPAPLIRTARVSLVVNMDVVSTQRLPQEQFTEIAGQSVRHIDKSESTHFPSAVLLYLKHGITS